MAILTEVQLRILRTLSPERWQRPMDVGGKDGSSHSYALLRLCTLGLVERRRRPSLANALGSTRGSWEYRLIKPSELAVRFTRELAGYGCAGVGQDPTDVKLCGKCGPCEAGRFLDAYGLRP